MIFAITSSADTYITNKIIDGAFWATDANVGRASTIDIFKLYNESTVSGTATPTEISRGLIKFPLDAISSLTGPILNMTHSSFEVILEMTDVSLGQPVPTNFHIIAFPLSQSFDEGVGKDVASFGDLDETNFVTASYSNGVNNLWILSGANSQGLLGSSDIDIIGSGNLKDGASATSLLTSVQTFTNGTENLALNVTRIVSATVAGLIPNFGFRLSLSGTEETDTKTRFVKRFASRHVNNPYIRPRLLVSFDDTIFDHHNSFFFDSTGSLFLKSFVRGAPSNIVSGSGLTQITGTNSLILTLTSGAFSTSVTASQHTSPGPLASTMTALTGVYSATFALASNNTSVVTASDTVANFVAASGSMLFAEYWSSTDGTIGFFTGSVLVKRADMNAYTAIPRNPVCVLSSFRNRYQRTDTPRIRVIVFDANSTPTPTKFHIPRQGLIVSEMYYQVRDADMNVIVLPFKTTNNGTRLSYDSQGMYFDFVMSSLTSGRPYQFEFLIKEDGSQIITTDKNSRFTVTS